ncbi:hypothetical protein ACFQS1_13035 [Paractinoplanes rhizophilus]|uniref:Uncharacterized protein n=1 Tax=Paractinoplanes rhizophilus TaxID=1416877 RepID=A0ABW2HP64_9ACTN
MEKTLANGENALANGENALAEVAQTPLDEARTTPIDRIGRAAAARVVRRVVRRDRDRVTPFSSGI